MRLLCYVKVSFISLFYCISCVRFFLNGDIYNTVITKPICDMLLVINSSNHSDLENSLQRSGEEMTRDMNTTLRSELAALQYKWDRLFALQVDLLQLEEELLDIDKDRLAIEETNLIKLENLEVENEVYCQLYFPVNFSEHNSKPM
ncbi:uncharacterized protein LOC142324837 isoform X2 [Lycorma delicatula]|uniref:uncharacterized protein LOC142324837 isoform X2 n=1 Tax=Lycorma delicatula TaxID=130591 RepID=UPI003F517E7D